jgi:hypothetical protein
MLKCSEDEELLKIFVKEKANTYKFRDYGFKYERTKSSGCKS